MSNYSRQRELIKKNLLMRYDHPTADDVYSSIRKELPNISLSTVYRNLKLLVQQNEVSSLDFGDGKEHFDGHMEPHCHFICKKCGAISDIFMDTPDIDRLAAAEFDGTIQGHYTYFYGLCRDCTKRSLHT